ncbi:hypothetical protein Pmani_004258 [Petrolisthes manimaculis]|uniref:Ionotropic glutamate receptor C-terminal domain-containing protein n=1 Tax=Petrolisthes manimaculis TaxID=1843537 RepID=A0AAE1QEY2_9EUCA|nr:hypothetical protein Pmani_004258 [Petrolisthes manimaculis]
MGHLRKYSEIEAFAPLASAVIESSSNTEHSTSEEFTTKEAQGACAVLSSPIGTRRAIPSARALTKNYLLQRQQSCSGPSELGCVCAERERKDLRDDIKVDMGLGPFSLNKARAELLDFTEPIITDYLRILARKGSPEVDQWGFLLPLTPVVWEAFLGSLVILLVAVYLLGFFVLHEDPHQSVRLDATFLVYLRVFLQQDIHTESLKWWSRLALGSWMLLTLVITRSYAGQLMSTLAVRFIPQPFHTLKALLDNPTTTMIWEANTAFVEHYKASKSGDLVRVLEADRKGIIRFIKTVDVTFAMDQLVRAGKHAVILENLTTRDLMAIDFSHKGRCDFYSSREPFMLFMNGLIAPRHSAIIQSMSKR